MNKRAANLSVDAALRDEAKALDLNLSATFEISLRAAVCLRRRAGARSTFFRSIMKYLNNPLISGLDQCLKKL